MKQFICIFFLAVLSFSCTAKVSFSKWHYHDTPLIENFFNMYQPCVVKVDDAAYPYRMWFFGWAVDFTNPGVTGCDAMFYARSKDLFNWEIWAKDQTWDRTMDPERWQPVMTADDEPFDQWHVGDPSVVLRDGVFFMAFSCTSKPFAAPLDGYPSQMLLFIRGAASLDGIHWKKCPKTLIAAAEYDTPQKSNPGRNGDFHRPTLMWNEGKWKLWFDYWNDSLEKTCMGYAENTGDFSTAGGFVIQHDLDEPLIEDWPNPEVIRIEGKYFCYSDAPGYGDYDRDDSAGVWLTRHAREAVSDDGIHWRLNNFIPRKNDETIHVPQTFVDTIDGRKRQFLFYAVQRMGLWNGSYDYRYKSINVLWRDIKQ